MVSDNKPKTVTLSAPCFVGADGTWAIAAISANGLDANVNTAFTDYCESCNGDVNQPRRMVIITATIELPCEAQIEEITGDVHECQMAGCAGEP